MLLGGIAVRVSRPCQQRGVAQAPREWGAQLL